MRNLANEIRTSVLEDILLANTDYKIMVCGQWEKQLDYLNNNFNYELNKIENGVVLAELITVTDKEGNFITAQVKQWNDGVENFNQVLTESNYNKVVNQFKK